MDQFKIKNTEFYEAGTAIFSQDCNKKLPKCLFLCKPL